MCLSVCACVHVRAHVCACTCMCVSLCVHMCVRVCVIIRYCTFLRLPEAKKFLAYCITHLGHQLSEEQHEECKFSICITLAGCLHRLGHHRDALDQIKVALKIKEDPKVLWFDKLVKRQLKYDEDRVLRFPSTLSRPLKFPSSIPVSLVVWDCVSDKEWCK